MRAIDFIGDFRGIIAEVIKRKQTVIPTNSPYNLLTSCFCPHFLQ